jgi:ketosteroid isomerase-like protein
VHPNARLIEAFYQAQARFYAGGDDTATLRRLLTDDIAWHVPGRSPIAGDYHGPDQVLGYFAARRDRANATFRVQPRGILADDQWAVQFASGRAERGGRRRRWETVGVYRIVDGKLAECWLLPYDQYLFDEIWS